MIRSAPRKYPAEAARVPRSRANQGRPGGRTPGTGIVAPGGTTAPRVLEKRRERDTLRAIRDYLALCPGVLAFRMNTGLHVATHKAKTRVIRYGVVGFPDLFGSVAWCYRVQAPRAMVPGTSPCQACGPRPFAFEVKAPGKKATPAQAAMLATLEAAGWLVATVESVDEVRRLLGR